MLQNLSSAAVVIGSLRLKCSISYSWIIYSIATLDETMEILFQQWTYTDLENQDTDLINKMIRKFQVFAKYFSKFMTNREFICGNRYV